MKKFLVATLAMALFAAPAAAAITDTAHDLSSGSAATIKGTSDEICVYCHTPHGATAAGIAPLWNRTTVNPTAIYNNGSLDHVTTQAGYDSSDAPLCLSCHDGASLAGPALNNPPNAGGTNPAEGNDITGEANLDTALNNDHPVGFVYDGTGATDAEIKVPTVAPVNFGAGSNEMWCSSCHDVHDNSKGQPFLVMSNTGSALCLDCHEK